MACSGPYPFTSPEPVCHNTYPVSVSHGALVLKFPQQQSLGLSTIRVGRKRNDRQLSPLAPQCEDVSDAPKLSSVCGEVDREYLDENEVIEGLIRPYKYRDCVDIGPHFPESARKAVPIGDRLRSDRMSRVPILRVAAEQAWHNGHPLANMAKAHHQLGATATPQISPYAEVGRDCQLTLMIGTRHDGEDTAAGTQVLTLDSHTRKRDGAGGPSSLAGTDVEGTRTYTAPSCPAWAIGSPRL